MFFFILRSSRFVESLSLIYNIVKTCNGISGKDSVTQFVRADNERTLTDELDKLNNTSDCMHDMIQTEACLQQRGILWNAYVSKQCRLYEKHIAYYHFGGRILLCILNP